MNTLEWSSFFHCHVALFSSSHASNDFGGRPVTFSTESSDFSCDPPALSASIQARNVARYSDIPWLLKFSTRSFWESLTWTTSRPRLELNLAAICVMTVNV